MERGVIELKDSELDKSLVSEFSIDRNSFLYWIHRPPRGLEQAAAVSRARRPAVKLDSRDHGCVQALQLSPRTRKAQAKAQLLEAQADRAGGVVRRGLVRSKTERGR